MNYTIIKIIEIINKLLKKIYENLKQNTLNETKIILNINFIEKIINFIPNDEKKSEFSLEFVEINIDLISEYLKKIQLLNSNISFYIKDISNDFLLFESLANKLILPNINDVINSIENLISQKIEPENYFIKNFEYNETKLELLLIFHNFLPLSTFDFLIFENRLFNYDLSNNQEILQNFSKKSGFELTENNTRIKFKKNKKINLNLFILINIIGNESNFSNQNYIESCLNEIQNEFNDKIKIFIQNISINLNMQTIISSLEEIYILTNNQDLYNNLDLLFKGEEKENIENKLYLNFLSSKK